MIDMKYIRWNRNNIFLFQPGGNVHCDVAMRLSKEAPISAGFVKIKPTMDGTDIIVECYGESTSLGLSSKPEDSLLVYQILKGESG